MYAQTHDRVEDRTRLLAFMREFSFGMLVTARHGAPQATQLPFLIVEQGHGLRLLAHMARANPHWHDFAERAAPAEGLAIFSGPHAYISPRHYERPNSVPTWDYVAVHARGRMHLLEGREEKLEALRLLSARHDPGWLAVFDSHPDEAVERRLNAIVAFELRIDRLEGRYKLSQDRSPGEKARIADALAAEADTAAQRIGEMIRQQLPKT